MFRAEHRKLLDWALEEIPPGQCRAGVRWDGPLRVWLETAEPSAEAGTWQVGTGGVGFRGGFPRIGFRREGVAAELDVEEGKMLVGCDPGSDGARTAMASVLAVALPVAMFSSRGSPLHAGVVERAGVALVVPGPSGAGKSTLSLQLARRPGLRFRCDELCFLTGGAELRVFPLRRDARPQPAAVDGVETTVRAAGGAPPRIGALLFPCARPGEESGVRRLTEREAFLRLLEATVAPLAPAPVWGHLDRLARLARSAPALAVTLGRGWECIPALVLNHLAGIRA